MAALGEGAVSYQRGTPVHSEEEQPTDKARTGATPGKVRPQPQGQGQPYPCRARSTLTPCEDLDCCDRSLKCENYNTYRAHAWNSFPFRPIEDPVLTPLEAHNL
jgi:hypothetical protein